MKLINKKAFYLILAAIIGYWAFQLVSLIINISDAEGFAQNIMDTLGSLSAEIDMGIYKNTYIVFLVIGFLVSVGLSSIFLIKLLSHKKTPKKGTYLTVLLVFACIIAGFNLISLLMGSLLSLPTFVITGLAIAGYAIQKNDRLTPYAPPTQPFYGYGQQQPPPYGQQPYGQQQPNQPPQQPNDRNNNL